MERDPFRLAWSHAKIGHLIIFLAGLCAIPIALLALDLPRQVIQDVVERTGNTRPLFLDIAWTPPLWLYDGTLIASRGWSLDAGQYVLAAFAVTLGLVLLRALVLGLIAVWRAHAADRLAEKLDTDLVRAIARARVFPNGVFESAKRATESSLALRGFLSGAVIVPFFASGRILLVCLYLLWLDPRAGLAGTIVAVLLLLLARWRLVTEARLGASTANSARMRTASIVEIGRRWQGLRAHGAVEQEFSRVTADLSVAGQAMRAPRRQGLMADQFLDMVAMAAPLIGPVLAVYLAITGGLSTGAAASMALALAALAAPARAMATWRMEYGTARRELRIVADTLASLRGAVDDGDSKMSATSDMTLEADNLVLGSGGSGPHLGPLQVSLTGPAHLALLAPSRREAELAATGFAGLAPVRSGHMLVGGQELDTLSAAQRAARVGYVASEPLLIPGTWVDNLSYGAPASLSRDELYQRVLDVLPVAGLDETLRHAALAAPVDPTRHPDLAGAVVDLRDKIRLALTQQDGWKDVVDPFRPDMFNRHATLGENIMFGQAVGDTFAPRNLAGQPFMKAVLEAENLTQTIVDMGLRIARTTIELLVGIADDNPLVARLGFFGPGERQLYAEVVARQGARRNGAVRAADRDRLLALALRYIESRHRLGLVDGALEQRLLGARRTFARLLPPSLRPAVDTYDPGRVCRAASLADNLLFGRIAYDVAGADERVATAIRKVLANEGRDGQLLALGLSTPLDMAELLDHPHVPALIDLARVLIRAPDVVVMAAEMPARLPALHAALKGKTLIAVCLDERHHGNFDGVLKIESGQLHYQRNANA